MLWTKSTWSANAAKFAACLMLTGAALAVPVMASDFNRETVATFNAPVELPGTTLPAGTYTFRILVPNEVVQVFDHNGQIVGSFVTAAAQRMNRGDATLTLEERPGAAPLAVGEWFFAGDQAGVEFLYPAR